jgi:hypothetical protein
MTMKGGIWPRWATLKAIVYWLPAISAKPLPRGSEATAQRETDGDPLAH